MVRGSRDDTWSPTAHRLHRFASMIGTWENEPTGEIPQPMLAGLLEEPVCEPTQVIPRPVLSDLLENCRPTPFAVRIRTPSKPPATTQARDEFADEEPAMIVNLPPAATDDVPPISARIATVLVSCVITCGCALVVGMMVL